MSVSVSVSVFVCHRLSLVLPVSRYLFLSSYCLPFLSVPLSLSLSHTFMNVTHVKMFLMCAKSVANVYVLHVIYHVRNVCGVCDVCHVRNFCTECYVCDVCVVCHVV